MAATWAQPNSGVTVTNLSWNATITPNASLGIGSDGTYTGTNPSPTGFTRNGAVCA